MEVCLKMWLNNGWEMEIYCLYNSHVIGWRIFHYRSIYFKLVLKSVLLKESKNRLDWPYLFVLYMDIIINTCCIRNSSTKKINFNPFCWSHVYKIQKIRHIYKKFKQVDEWRNWVDPFFHILIPLHNIQYRKIYSLIAQKAISY